MSSEHVLENPAMRQVPRSAEHWSERKELVRGYTCYRVMFLIFNMLPPVIMRILALPVGFFYFLFVSKARVASKMFQVNIKPAFKEKHRFLVRPLRQIVAFALTIVEKVQAWGGEISISNIHFQQDDISGLIGELEKGKGALLICSHLGNAELLRGLASYNRTGVSRNVPVTSIVDFSCTAYFNQLLKEINPKSMTRIISANDIGPDTVILLQERIAAGELVVIAGDRTSAKTRDRTLTFPFFGINAPFAYGAFFLAAILNAPTYFVFALRKKDISIFPEYDMHVHKNRVSFDCSRKERNERIQQTAENFVRLLEKYCREKPYQWYNFYDFWAMPEATHVCKI